MIFKKKIFKNIFHIFNRFIGVLLPAIPIVIYTKQPIFPEGKRIILVLRCFLGTTGLMLSFYAFRHMPLGDASVIIFSTPVFVAIFARLFLKEQCGLINIITIMLTLIGVVLITRPSIIFTQPEDEFSNDFLSPSQSTSNRIWGSVAAVASTLFGANVYILLRALKDIHFAVIMSNFGMFALLYTFIVCWTIGAICWPSCGSDRILIVVLALFSFLGQILLTISLQIEQAGPVAIARCADIVFAFIWQWLFFGDKPTGYSLFGALLVVSSVIITALKKWALSLPRDSVYRKRLNFLIIE